MSAGSKLHARTQDGAGGRTVAALLCCCTIAGWRGRYSPLAAPSLFVMMMIAHSPLSIKSKTTVQSQRAIGTTTSYNRCSEAAQPLIVHAARLGSRFSKWTKHKNLQAYSELSNFVPSISHTFASVTQPNEQTRAQKFARKPAAAVVTVAIIIDHQQPLLLAPSVPGPLPKTTKLHVSMVGRVSSKSTKSQ